MRILPIFFLSLLLLASCSARQTKRYAVVCQFGEIMHETECKKEAFDRAEDLTMLGRVFASKPQYFVIEK